MRYLLVIVTGVGLAAGLLVPGVAAGQALEPERDAAVSQSQQAQPSKPAPLPPAGSPPLLRYVQIDFPTQGGVSTIDPETYLYFLKTAEMVSRPSEGVWLPYNEQVVLEDFRRLWNTKFLDNLWVEVKDVPWENGVMGKHVIFNLEERQRVKIVDYVGSTKLEQSKIEEKLREEEALIRLDTFIDAGMVQKVKSIVTAMLGEKGYQYATVTPQIKALPGGPKLVQLTFVIDEGPKVQIRQIDFVGNRAVSDWTLRRQMKENKSRNLLSIVTGKGAYQEAKFEDDADKVISYYRDRGYIAVRVGEPELKTLEDSKDRKTRWVQLRIPVEEGARYRVGKLDFDGQTVVKEEALRALFSKVKPGKYYSEKVVRKAFEKAREVYGTVGYWEFTGYPDLKAREAGGESGAEAAAAGAQGPDISAEAAGQARQDSKTAGTARLAGQPAATPTKSGSSRRQRPAAPIVDVTIRLQEGKQYFVNRITFVGNTTTRDNVVRRELRLFENGVFNTEALKYSIKRINQLGYFKALEGGKDVQVDKTPGAENTVDITLKFEEQNRNQITFGAGISQYEGFFGQVMFQTANFLGRGETLSVSLSAGSRAQNYQVAFTEPYLFDRAMTVGVDVYKRELKYINQFTQASIGGNFVFGFPLADFTRMFLTYSYEDSRIKDVNPIFTNPTIIQPIFYDPLTTDPTTTPIFYDPAQSVTVPSPYASLLSSLLLPGYDRPYTISRISPSIVKNTVDQPIFPTTGHRLSAQLDIAGLGGNTSFLKPVLEGVLYLKHTNRTSLGMRAQVQYIMPYRGTTQLPVFEKLWLGGEYSVRGFDIRTIGPKFPDSPLVEGGNKSLLFNAEYLITIAGPVRLVLFFDAGQALAKGQRFAFNEFKTSTGGEVRFFMPVLNVPFRLIMAYNPHRSGVLDNNYEPARRFSFRFAVGSTF